MSTKNNRPRPPQGPKRSPNEATGDPTEWNNPKPPDRTEGTGRNAGNAIQLSWWNLLLALPLVMLFTVFYNKDTPRLFGLPVFYWVQFGFVFVGVATVAVVYSATKRRRFPPAAAGREAGGRPHSPHPSGPRPGNARQGGTRPSGSRKSGGSR